MIIAAALYAANKSLKCRVSVNFSILKIASAWYLGT